MPIKVGDRVVCVKKPEFGNYECKVGEIMIVSDIFSHGELIRRKDSPIEGKSECFRIHLFEKANKINPKEFYNKY